MPRNLDLDVDAPEKIPNILRTATEVFYDSSSELSSAWQDREAGKIWSRIAKILERAAYSIDKIL